MYDGRLVRLAGGHNFRDFGGYTTEDGRHLRRGMLFRSGVMSHIDSGDAVTLRALGIETICDLRTAEERRHRPTKWHGAATEMLADDATQPTATLQALLADPYATRADMAAAMVALYAELPFKHVSMYRLMMRRLAEGRAPLLVNCSAGKDRTGVGVAIVLRALGVSPRLVEEDYLASNYLLDVPRLLADSGYEEMRRENPDATSAMMVVSADYLASAFDAMDERCGSFGAYLAEKLEVDAGDIRRIRTLLLD
jgi:protein-tyrosine phosphatase